MKKNNKFVSSLKILSIWILSISNGQDLYIQQFRTQQGLSQNQIWAISQDYYGYLWIGTRKGLNRFNGIQMDKIGNILNGFGPFLTDTRIYDLEINENKLVLATGYGIHEFDISDKKVICSLNELAELNYENQIARISCDINDKIPYRINYNEKYGYFVGTYADGIYLLDNEFNVIQSFETTISKYIMDIFIDKNQIIWIATDGDGLFRVNPTQFENYKLDDNKYNNIVWALKADANSKNVIMGTVNELIFIDENRNLIPSFKNEFEKNSIILY